MNVTSQANHAWAWWKEAATAAQAAGGTARAKDLKIHLVDTPPESQAMIMIGWRLPPRSDTGAMAMALLGEIIDEAAARPGLTARVDGYHLASTLMVEEKVTREEVATALRGILEVIARIRSGKISEDEVAAAKRHLEGDFLLALSRPGGLSHLESIRQMEELPADYWAGFQKRVQSVTLARMKTAAAHLDPATAAIVVVGVGDDKALADQLAPLGQVE